MALHGMEPHALLKHRLRGVLRSLEERNQEQQAEFSARSLLGSLESESLVQQALRELLSGVAAMWPLLFTHLVAGSCTQLVTLVLGASPQFMSPRPPGRTVHRSRCLRWPSALSASCCKQVGS